MNQNMEMACLLVSEKNVPEINIMGIWLTISPYINRRLGE